MKSISSDNTQITITNRCPLASEDCLHFSNLKGPKPNQWFRAIREVGPPTQVRRPADPKWWEVLGESLATIFSEFYALPTMSVSGLGYSLLEDCSETCLSRLNPRTRSTRKTVLCTVCGGLQSLEYLPNSISHELALSIFRKLKYLSCSERILEYWFQDVVRVSGKTTKTEENIEAFSMKFDKDMTLIMRPPCRLLAG